MALKVYRTPIGFHDAFVAATSQKAALKAWGADKDLFARGDAEVVTDPVLTAAPLSAPGEVIRRLRGTAAEQMAAAPAVAPTARKRKPTPAAPSRPPPDRSRVVAAEAALAEAEAAHRAAEQLLAEEERALAARRHDVRAEWIAQRDALEAGRDAAEEEYGAALARWQAG